MQLQRRHERAARAFIASRLFSRHDGEDLAQDVWTAVWEKLPTQFHGGSFRAWVFQIAAHRCIDHGRKKRPELFPDGALPDGGPGAADPTFQAIILREKAARLEACIDKLPGNQRCVVVATLRGKKTGDAAIECGLTPNSAAKAKCEAIGRLSACVAGADR